MPVLGADTEGLSAVGNEWRTAGDVSIESGTTVVNTCNASVDSILAEMERAERTCLDAIQSMADGNTRAFTALTGVEYTGRNAEVAREDASELQQRCQKAQADMQAAFAEARAGVTTLGESVTTIAGDYQAYAVQVGESGATFSKNMETQRANLEAAMNSLG